MTQPPDERLEHEDPLVRTARREAVVVGLIFVSALTYTVTYCTRFGYNRSIESLTFVLGFPDWIFWGILVPWGVCTVLGCWLSYGFIQDHDFAPDDASAGSADQSI